MLNGKRVYNARADPVTVNNMIYSFTIGFHLESLLIKL